MYSRNLFARLEALEDRLAPAQLLSSPPDADVGRGVGLQEHLFVREMLVVITTEVRIDVSITLSGGSQFGANMPSATLSTPAPSPQLDAGLVAPLTGETSASRGSDVGNSPGGNAADAAKAPVNSQPASPPAQTTVAPKPTVPASQDKTSSTLPAGQVGLATTATSATTTSPTTVTTVLSQVSRTAAGNTNAPQAPIQPLAAVSSASQAVGVAPNQGPIGFAAPTPNGTSSRQPPFATYLSGGAGEQEEGPDFLPSPPAEPSGDVAPAIDPADAGLEPAGEAVAPTDADQDDQPEAALTLAGLVGEGSLPSWLVFALAVSAVALSRIDFSRPQARWDERSSLLVEEKPIH